jgi:hypothetical protein
MSAFPSTRRLDHLVLPARDLDDRAELYRRIGFTVGARNRHPWGTENHIVQFDGTFLELIGIGADAAIPAHGPATFSFGRHVADTLAAGREGLSMLVLDSAAAGSDARWFTQAGIGGYEPFRFERRGTRPDGTPSHVAFTLGFAHLSALPETAFFVCQQHFPEAFWNPAMQKHPNGVTGVRAVTLVAADVAGAAAGLVRFAGGAAVALPGGMRVATAGGALDVLSPDAAAAAFGEDTAFRAPGPGGACAITFHTPDVEGLARRLAEGGVAHRRDATRAVVASARAGGVLLAFEGT